MDIQPQNTQPMSDDQELAKVLAGVSDKSEENDDPMALSGLENTDITKDSSDKTSSVSSAEDDMSSDDKKNNDSSESKTESTNEIKPAYADTSLDQETNVPGELEDVKKNVIMDLRPIMDKLSSPPDEMFNLYLLLIRSTDDKTLIQPAYDTAKKITDESVKAQALLDIIKEIDFLSSK